MSRKFIFIFLLSLMGTLSSIKAELVNKQELKSGWNFRQTNLGKWLPATVPGTVHTDLMDNKLIENPFYRNNEPDVQWIDKINWEYSLTFRPENQILDNSNQQLTFYGLDTWCDIFLNGEKIASPDNMFRIWKVNVKGKLKKGDNTLNIRFRSPITKGLEEMEKYGLSIPASNDYSQFGGMGPIHVSVYTRKAPYHFGWDWGPRLVTSGIWRPVILQGWDNVKIEDLFIRQHTVTKTLAKLAAQVTYLADIPSELQIDILYRDKTVATQTLSATQGTNHVQIPFTVKNPDLWWSNGLGAANISRFDIKIRKGTQTVAEKSVNTGLRSLRLIRKPDDKGTTFYFELNGTPVFAKGTNAIPNDIFLPRITRKDYEKVVADATDANMNMIRIWGGGIYEDDYFYELCDRNGIMIWQDFMFACAMYPGNQEFLDNVRQEAIDNVIRLRNHPCIALWCGNNEIDVAWARWGWKKDYNEVEQQQISKAYIDIFHKLLPEIIAEYTDGDDYWPSSPMSAPDVDAHELLPATSGDNHYWGVWHQKHRFEEYEKNIGRFISEYGFQSFPEFNTVKKYALPEDYNIESEVMAAHQRSGIGNLRIKEYMGWYYNVPEDFEQFLYMSQVLQAKAMRAALHTHRRAMPYCMGSLMWQLNDCWPVAGWSTTDYYHNWKAAHYASREACKQVIAAPRMSGDTLEIWIVNDNLKSESGNYTLELLDFEGKTLNRIFGKFTAKANNSDKILTIQNSKFLKGHKVGEVLALLTLNTTRGLLDEQTLYFTEPKNMALPAEPGIHIERINKDGKKYISVTSQKLACDVMFYSTETPITFMNNYIDLLPGKNYLIELATDATDFDIKTRYIQ